MHRIQRAIGMGSDHLLDALLGEDHDHGQDDALSAAHDTLYAQFWSRLAPLDAAADLLREGAARGWRVVLASSAKSIEAKVMTDALGVDEVVFAITTADDMDGTKPAPDLVRRALEKAAVAPGGAVFVGDAVWDSQSARKAGVRCLAVLTGGGFSRQELTDAGAEEVYDTLADLLAAIDDSALASLPAAD
ncbi:HAD family hydrolase [Streptomyces sp. V4-01]|uniref:HAD family hydrolase n=1 Tax=Actinacidiphila polyblastidii TaxID=3110430 RepID=A0ABU7PE23_9ACTN|nr:HAD family hydrolase [Streptomyces sp. V4-01]